MEAIFGKQYLLSAQKIQKIILWDSQGVTSVNYLEKSTLCIIIGLLKN